MRKSIRFSGFRYPLQAGQRVWLSLDAGRLLVCATRAPGSEPYVWWSPDGTQKGAWRKAYAHAEAFAVAPADRDPLEALKRFLDGGRRSEA